ncbi:SusD-like starch-binding protein associating with outer membrane [Dyadobacter jejuensis]|uniref:SusD-like starch-binding protein associating with outer membrane n=1 Tax=Dyadobacter jejuensis TaxID=1082580 RepID=A0A316AYF2_9BACT|nr:SusD/RagB family nutrient-binding outer membrane lipoprotein [Dyadobacter jejuensis]PWJ55247.1 SusD-like starch-binding protein associating with outer membrane [Dyadobacter jejuensis]
MNLRKNNQFFYLMRASWRVCILGFFLVFWTGCDNGFEELNIDPNNPTKVPSAYLLSSAQQNLIKEIFGMANTSGKDVMGMRYIQMWSSTLYTEEDRYVDIESDFSTIYKGGLTDLYELIRLNTDPNTAVDAALSGPNQNQIAVARIMRAWTFHTLTDIWGDIPYFQAVQGLDFPTPVYDPQADIYADLIAELDAATAEMSLEAGKIQGDIIYDGDMASWKRFAQSLKLRIGMRMSKVDPALAEKTVTEALASGVFTSNEQGASFQYLTAQPNYSPWYYSYYVGTPTLAVANTLIDQLLALEDPRISKYAKIPDNGGQYTGIPYGVSAAVAGSFGNKNVSFPSLEVLSADAQRSLMSYSEVLFIEAEAAARGWITADAATLYNDAIAASMRYWGVDEEDIAPYLAKSEVTFNEANYAKSIGEQKWLAFYMQGVQAWAEWRRLDYPQLLPAPDAANGRGIPRRRGYPLEEINLNRENYAQAIARQGADLLETRIWWDLE